MIQLEAPIQTEYERVLQSLEGQEPNYGHSCLSSYDVVRAHFLIANHFYLEGQGLGGVGPKDLNLLLSAVSRQVVEYGGRVKWTDRFDICATLFFGLIKNHPFHDANKRTAFLSLLYLLHLLGWCPSVSEKEFEDFTVEIADNQLGKYARYQKLKKDGHPDPEVAFISWYLRSHTRRIDTSHYGVTYRELQAILNRFGFALANPRHNHIDVVKTVKRSQLFGLLGEKTVEVRLGQIGFPRWSAEVGKGAIKTVRDVTGLTHDNGVDSAAFFQGLDPIQSLIATYNQPLMSLAHR